MRILITGPKASGKSTIGKLLSEKLSLPFVETDSLTEEEFQRIDGRKLSCREICKEFGEKRFREIESIAIELAAEYKFCVMTTGGMTMLNPKNRNCLRKDSIIIYLNTAPMICWERLKTIGIPSFLSPENPQKDFMERMERINDVVMPYADIVVEFSADEAPEQIAEKCIARLEEEFSITSSKFSSFGLFLRLHTFGESHGPAIGAVLDGIPPGISLSEEDIQKELDRRRPGQSSISTARKEEDKVKILSGVFEGKTTGTPIALLIENKDQKSKDYEEFRQLFRPGHADFTFWAKYGIRDHRGGGRSSGRETAARVAGGAIAKKYLSERGIKICAYALEIGEIKAKKIDLSCVEKNSVRCPDMESAVEMEALIEKVRKQEDSIGGIIQIEITGVPPGLGDPVFAKLDAKFASAFFSLGAVKGLEFGAGFAAAKMLGSENNDNMRDGKFLSNNAGGILGGISSGQDIVARIAVKPTPSIAKKQLTCSVGGENAEIEVKGRHDPCIVPRLVPVVESMAALVLLDCLLIQEKIRIFNTKN